MILGLSVGAFTTLHVLISLIAIAAGFLVVAAMLAGRPAARLTAFYLATTIATSVTGFFFHSKAVGPPHIVGVVSLVVLAIALVALYGRNLVGLWRPTYVVTAMLALYLNCFVGVVQSFQKVGVLKALAPTGTEPPFLVAQGLTLVIFAGLGFLALARFHDSAAPAAVAAQVV